MSDHICKYVCRCNNVCGLGKHMACRLSFSWYISTLGRIAVLPTYIDASYCYRPTRVVCRSVCLSVTLVSPAKTTAPMEMPFWFRTRVGQLGTTYSMGVQIFPWEGAILRGQRASHCKVYGHSAVICAKTAEPIAMPFGLMVPDGGDLSGPPTECRYCRYPAPKGRCHDNHFLAFDGL